MADLTLKENARLHAFGVVGVYLKDGTLARPEWKITAEELAELHASARGAPPGVTKEEWESGRVIVRGYCLGSIGEYLVQEDGRKLIRYADDEVNGGRIDPKYAYVDDKATEVKDAVTGEVVGDLDGGALKWR